MAVLVDVEVEHVPGEPSEEPGVDPTCLEPGYHYEVTCCEKCGEELKREKVTDSALGHDWGDWEVVRKATAEEEGLEESVCRRCGETRERAIPKRAVARDETDTGDQSRLELWILLAVAAVAGIGGVIFMRRK